MVYAGTSTGSSTDSSATFTAWTTFRVYVAPPRPVHRCLHYLFDLPCNVPRAELRRAYRRLAKIAHPDLNPERRQEMGRWMTVLNRVYEALEAA